MLGSRKLMAWRIATFLYCLSLYQGAALANPSGSQLEQLLSQSFLDAERACAQPRYAQQVTEALAADLQQLFHDLGAGYPDVGLVGRDAVQNLRTMDAAGSQQLCTTVSNHETLSSLLSESLRQGNTKSNSECFDNGRYITLTGLSAALRVVQGSLQVVCDLANCDDGFDGFFACLALCAGPAAIGIADVGIQHALTLDDKCSGAEHERWMSNLRNQTADIVPSLGDVVANNTIPQLNRISRDSVTNDDIDALNATIRSGFGATRGSQKNGVQNTLSQLLLQIQQGLQQQANQEEQSMRLFIERSLASRSNINTLQRPARFDGLLDEVREVVAASIQSADQAGIKVDDALAQFRQGDGAFNSGKYQLAYTLYRNAYSQVLIALDTAAAGGQP